MNKHSDAEESLERMEASDSDQTDEENSDDNDTGEVSEDESEIMESEDADDDDDADEEIPVLLSFLMNAAKSKVNAEQEYDTPEEVAENYKRLVPLYRKLFRQDVVDLFHRLHELKKHSLYKDIMDTIQEFKDKKFSTTEAISSAISQRKYRINQLFPDELSEDEDGDEDEVDQ